MGRMPVLQPTGRTREMISRTVFTAVPFIVTCHTQAYSGLSLQQLSFLLLLGLTASYLLHIVTLWHDVMISQY